MRQSVVQPPLSKCYHTTSRNCWFGFQFTTQLETWCLGVVWLPLQSWTSRPVTGAAHFSWIFLQPGAQGKLNDRATPFSNTVTKFITISPGLFWYAEQISKAVVCFFSALSFHKRSSTWLLFLFFPASFFFPRHALLSTFSLCTLLPSLLSPRLLLFLLSHCLSSPFHSPHPSRLPNWTKTSETNRKKYHPGTRLSASSQSPHIAPMEFWGQERGRNKDLCWDCCASEAPLATPAPGFMSLGERQSGLGHLPSPRQPAPLSGVSLVLLCMVGNSHQRKKWGEAGTISGNKPL